MRRLLTFFILVSLLVAPAFAQTVTYACPSDKAIYTLNFEGNSPVDATFKLFRADGSMTSGSWTYEPYTFDVFGIGIYDGYKTTITLDGVSAETTHVSPNSIKINLYPARNLTELAENRLIMGAGQIWGVNDVTVEKYGVNSPIVGFKVIADSEITYKYREDARKTIAGNLASQNAGEIMEIIYSTITTAISFLIDLGYWLKFFFIDNLTMILALFLAVPMAFAAKNSRGNPEKFMRQYFKTLRGFFEFIFQVWRLLLESIGTVRGWFRI